MEEGGVERCPPTFLSSLSFLSLSFLSFSLHLQQYLTFLLKNWTIIITSWTEVKPTPS